MTPNDAPKGVELLACPFCGEADGEKMTHPSRMFHIVHCQSCWASGPVPVESLRDTAESAWNRRANVEASAGEWREERARSAADYQLLRDFADRETVRAERLAEALRECRSDYEHALGISENIYRHWCNTGANGAMPNDTWACHCARRIEQIDALTTPAQPGETE